MDRLPESTRSMRKYASEAGGLRAARQGPHGRSLTARTAHSMSTTALRTKSKSAASLLRRVPFAPLRPVLANLQEVFLGTKLAVLFPAVPLAIAAQCAHFGQVWVFTLSLLGLIPLAERVSFLTEQIAIYTGPTVGGLLNATCGNATELIIALFALMGGQIEVVKCSLLGSVLSNLLLVLGTSLFCGGVVNLGSDQPYDRTQADVSTGLLILGVLCQSLPLMLRYAVGAGEHSVAAATTVLDLSRACSVVMLLAYVAYLFFQLKTHAQLFEPQEVDDGCEAEEDEQAVIGFASGFFWLAFNTVLIAILSEYVVGTIEVPLSVIVAWIAGIQMDLDFKLIETGSLFVSVIVTAFTLQVHTHTHTTYSPFSSLMNIQANHFTAFAGWFVTLPQGDPSAAVLHCDRCMLLCYEATCNSRVLPEPEQMSIQGSNAVVSQKQCRAKVDAFRSGEISAGGSVLWEK
ncbi:Vacuolar cation/proton exchanger 1a [Zea mays]|uniref:Vacuolar cation/proton exchanger 1a n=1 Tax=Zea mays TaxID=4577 RepID=A0A3L6FHQ8_MAIZE|nr:Vacuolar cation/proton exchanger 1a [Zea mays]